MARAPHAVDPMPEPAPGATPPRRARLRERLQALLRPRPPAAPPAERTHRAPGSSWPDSFFDVDAGP